MREFRETSGQRRASPARGVAAAAFTLIELLVVIAVIAILAALLLPALSGAKESGRIARCQNNLHQMSLGLEMYVEDAHAYPVFSYDLNGAAIVSLGVWSTHLIPYLKHDWTNDLCTEFPSYRGLTLAANSTYQVPLGSYGYNANGVQFGLSQLGLGGCLTDPSNTNSIQPINESAVVMPADMIAMGDANLMWVLPGILKSFYGVTGPASYSGYARLDITSRDTTENPGYGGSAGILQAHQQRHRGTFNVVFCDGHIERPAEAKLFDNSSGNLVRWNNDHQPHADMLNR